MGELLGDADLVVSFITGNLVAMPLDHVGRLAEPPPPPSAVL